MSLDTLIEPDVRTIFCVCKEKKDFEQCKVQLYIKLNAPKKDSRKLKMLQRHINETERT